MKFNHKSATVVVLACLCATVAVSTDSPSGSNEVAARYHLRQRTQRFFQRATQPQPQQAQPQRNAPNTRPERATPSRVKSPFLKSLQLFG